MEMIPFLCLSEIDPFPFREWGKKNQKYSVLVETECVLPVFLTGVCNLCNGGVKFVRNNDRNRLTF